MTAREYNKREILAGRLTAEHLLAIFDVARLDLESEVRTFQRLHKLDPIDGMAGPMTRAAAEGANGIATLTGPVYWPLWGGCYWSGNLFRPGAHNGRDGFSGPKTEGGWPNSVGAVVGAVADGHVIRVTTRRNGWWCRLDHGSGIESLSGHLEPSGLVVAGDKVAAGQKLGVLWGRVHPPHIHHEITRNGRLIEPVRFLEAEGARVHP